ncbi:MAG: TRAP transporter small permease [Treponematales bacterium]|jgi:TRAP-type C4-dicarboxylate transport system permease small subunit
MKKFLDTVFKGIEILIAFFLALMIILTFANVVLRYIFSKGFVQSEEIARLCFIYLVYLGSIEAMRDNRHLIIDSVISRLPVLARKVLYGALQACIVWLMYILTVGSWKMVLQTTVGNRAWDWGMLLSAIGRNSGDRWVATQVPYWFVYFSGLLMGVTIAILAIANIVRLVFFKVPVEQLLAARDGVDDKEVATQEAS